MNKKKIDNELIEAYEHKVVFDAPIFWNTKPKKKELEMVDKIMYGIVEAQKYHQADYMGVDVETMRIEQTPCECSLHPFRNGYLIKTQTFLIFKIYERVCGKVYIKNLKKPKVWEGKDDKK